MHRYHCLSRFSEIKLWARAKLYKFYVINHQGIAHWIIDIPNDKDNTVFLLNYGDSVRLWTSDFSS